MGRQPEKRRPWPNCKAPVAERVVITLLHYVLAAALTKVAKCCLIHLARTGIVGWGQPSEAKVATGSEAR